MFLFWFWMITVDISISYGKGMPWSFSVSWSFSTSWSCNDLNTRINILMIHLQTVPVKGYPQNILLLDYTLTYSLLVVNLIYNLITKHSTLYTYYGCNEYSFHSNIHSLFWYWNIFLVSGFCLMFEKLNMWNFNFNKMATGEVSCSVITAFWLCLGVVGTKYNDIYVV